MNDAADVIEFPGPRRVPDSRDNQPIAVSGAELLDEIALAFRRHISLPERARDAIALWALFAHTFDAWQANPRLLFTSPVPQCGKSTALTMLGKLTPRARLASNVTGPVVFRLIEQEHPTLLIDEADTFLGGKSDLGGILNSGHTPAAAFVWRCDGPEHKPRPYSTWTPLVIAGIGTVSPALHTRSIEIKMRRRRPDEHIEPISSSALADLDRLNQMASQWAVENIGTLAAAAPAMPVGLINRARDNWCPLLAIADLAGDRWPDLARNAAVTLSGGAEEQSQGVTLLGGIRRVLEAKGASRISSESLCRALGDLEDAPWADHAGGVVLTTRRLAAELKPFGISPRVFRAGPLTPRGYAWDQFEDAFARYLPPSAAKPQQRNN
jgi:putative DNA primase/helicase